MDNYKIITLSFDLGQVCNDVLVNCNLISQTIKDLADQDIKANVQQPDNPETRSIICRAVTEAFGKAKVACQRYLMKGRTSDNNNLERLVSNVTYIKIEVQDEDSDGHLLYNCTVSSVATVVYTTDNGTTWKDASDDSTVEPDATPTPKMKEVTTDEIDTITYEIVVLTLKIPNFNTAVTDHLKSMIHKYVVDWVMYRFLTDQVNDKAEAYKKVAEEDDYSSIISDLNARERYTMRKPSFM